MYDVLHALGPSKLDLLISTKKLISSLIWRFYFLKFISSLIWRFYFFINLIKKKTHILNARKELHLSSLLYCCFYFLIIISTFVYFFTYSAFKLWSQKKSRNPLLILVAFLYLLKWKAPLHPRDINLSSLIKQGKMKMNLYRSFQRSIWKDKMKLLGKKMTCQVICLLPLITNSQCLLLHCLRLIFIKNNCEESLFHFNTRSPRNK